MNDIPRPSKVDKKEKNLHIMKPAYTKHINFCQTPLVLTLCYIEVPPYASKILNLVRGVWARIKF